MLTSRDSETMTRNLRDPGSAAGSSGGRTSLFVDIGGFQGRGRRGLVGADRNLYGVEPAHGDLDARGV